MEEMSVLEPNSVVPPGRVIPTGQVWGGSPAQFVRTLSKDEKMDMGAGSLAEKEGLVVDGYYGDGIDGQGDGAWVEAVAGLSAGQPVVGKAPSVGGMGQMAEA